MTLLVSVHDVTPAREPGVRRLWDLCDSRGVIPALLVVPNWHGVAPLSRAPDFVAWLRERAALGAELFLHGERHDEVGSPRSPIDSLRALGRTAREGEFLTLAAGAARDRIQRGLAVLRSLGLEPIGFVPPAWLARPATWEAVSDSGLRLSEDDRAIRIHPALERLPSPVIRWSARTAVRAWTSAAVAEARGVVQHGARIVRIALHPGDLDHSASRASIDRTLDMWLDARPAGRYADLLHLTE